MLKLLLFTACLANVYLVVLTTDSDVYSESYASSSSSSSSSYSSSSSLSEDDDCSLKCTEPHEVLDTCVQAGCGPRNCSQLGKPIPCPRIDPRYCRKDCVCESGFVWNDCGKCIKKTQCPACNDDPNAVSGCSMICSKWCPDHRKKNPAPCSDDICEINGCVCRKNYVYDYNQNVCVRPKKCTPACGSHEVYSDCTNGGCDARNCTQLGKPIPCVKLDPDSCIKGCICESGYLRASNGTCVPTDQCPPTCKVNEVYSNCSNGLCRFENCTQYGQPLPFCPRFDPNNCKGGCICLNKYLRNSKGICIPQEECPEAKCTTTTTTEAPVNGACSNGEAEQRLLAGNLKFTGQFFYQTVKKNIGSSVIMSPFSVLVPLAQLCLYTDKGESYDQLMNVLNLKSKDEIRCTFPELTKSYESQTQSELALAAKVYVSDSENLTEKFLDDTKTVFDAEAESINFTDSQNAADTINAWVQKQTRDRIKNLVSPSMFSKLTRLVLTNAIYFLGNWNKQFNPNQTSDRTFYLTDNTTIERPTMYQKGSFKYAEIPALDAKIVQILYKGGNFSYVAFVPNTVDGYVELSNKLQDPDVLNNALDQLAFKSCVIYIPKYHTATTIDLSDVLQMLNVTDIFDASKANLNGILKDNNEKLFVSAAVQKADVTVDEVGTEAAAANAIIVGTTAVQQTYLIEANRSFLYYILLYRTPLFCGAVTGK